MPPKRDIKKAAEEKAKQRRAEAARKEAELKKADEAKKAEAGRRVKEENMERNKRGETAPAKEPVEVQRKTSRAQEDDPNARKRRRFDQPPETVVLDPPASSTVPPSTAGEGQEAPKAPPRQDAPSTSHERAPGPVPLQIEYPRTPASDSPAWNPQILIPSLEFPAGRPFTLADSAFNHPELFLKGITPPRDMQRARKNKIEDIHNTMMKNLLSSTFYSMELIARSKALHDKAGKDDAYINAARAKEKSNEKEIKELRKQLEATNSRIKVAEDKAEASERKMKIAERHLASKDEELVNKTSELLDARAGASSARKELDQVVQGLQKAREERDEAKEENWKLKLDLRTYMSAALDMEKALQEAESKGAEDLEAQFNDFVGQMEDARNEYFLDGWEAAMSKLGIDPASESFRNVPFPNPDSLIPKFSFERDPQTPTVEGPSEQTEETEKEGAAPEDVPSKEASKIITEVVKSVDAELSEHEPKGDEPK